MTTKLPINEIKLENRQRVDYGNIADLAASLKTHGLIQPIVVDQNKRLIAGGRRLAAAISLGWTEIQAVFRETLTLDELHELELIENVQRKDMSWQEEVLSIATIHRLKQTRLGVSDWGQDQTGRLLGVNQAKVSFALRMSALLKRELGPDGKPTTTARFWKCDNFNSAWSLHLRDAEDRITKVLANQPLVVTAADDLGGPPIPEVSPEALSYERERYEANPLNTVPFDQYWTEKQALEQRELPCPVINLTSHFFHGDSIQFMNATAQRFDHVITDIPYGIDMDMLNQQSSTMKDLDTVEAEHDVDYNLQLIADFFPAAFHCTKDHAFVITWCDQMLWQYMYDHAKKAGFSVQRWPFTWCKTSQCMNQSANQNFTKNTEIAMICRKPGTALAKMSQTSYLVTGKDDLCERIAHKFAKPFACWQALVEPASIEGQTILEPFAGRGSGVLSMLTMKRDVVAVELQENHYNHLLENVKQHYLTINPRCQFV